jgi:predicted MFS family arabinose efflux permease
VTTAFVPAALSARWTGLQARVLLILLLVITCNYVDRSLLGILQEPVKQSLKLTDWQVGLVGGPSFAIFYALAGLPSARWAERADRGKVLPIILTVWSSMTAVCGAALNFTMLALARAGVGLGEGGCIPISHSLVSEYFSTKQRGVAISILSSASSIGGFVAATLGSVIAQRFGWRAAFVAVGLPGVLLALTVRLTIKDPRVGAQAAKATAGTFRSDAGWLLKNPTFVLIFAANAINSIGNSALLLFTSAFFLRTYHMSLVQAGAIYATGQGVIGFMGALGSGVLADRFAGARGRSYVLIPALAAAASGILFITAFTRDTWWVAVAFLLPAYGFLEMKAPSLAAVQSISPPHMRATSAAMLFLGITTCGSGLGGPIVGAISDAVASSMLPSGWGGLAHACPGGRAPPGAAEAVAHGCQMASAAGVRAGLLGAAALFGLSAVLFFLASRTIDMPTSEGPARP